MSWASPSKVARILGRSDIFHVDEFACRNAALVLRQISLPHPKTPWSKYPTTKQFEFKLAFVAVCHQINWDFLQNRLFGILLRDEPADLAQRLSVITARDIKKLLADYDKPNRIRAVERAKLLRDIGLRLLELWGGDASQLIDATGGRVAGPMGYLETLNKFAAYSEDPLRKKSHVLLQDLLRERIVEINDPENIIPAIDYHIIRLYLRTGRVVSIDPIITPYLQERPYPRPRLVKLLRKSVADALSLTSLYADMPVADLNAIEWQLGRTLCILPEPRCDSTTDESELAQFCKSGCGYRSFCAAYRKSEERSLKEPQFFGRFY
jgi:hypothetical protein